MMYHKRIVEEMKKFLDFDRIGELAAATGFIKRKRKIAGIDFLFALAFGNGHGDTRSLADIRRFMTSVADFDMTSSAFQSRFTSEAVDFLKKCYAEILSNYLKNSTAITYSTELKNFNDVKAIDSTVITLADKLARIFRGYKNAGAKAALKFTGVMSLQSGVFEQSYVHSARNRKKERPRLSRCEIKNCLFLFDLGLASWKWFRKIDRNGGSFITRVKSSGNPSHIHQWNP